MFLFILNVGINSDKFRWAIYKQKVKIDEHGCDDMHGPGINITFGKSHTSPITRSPH
jgi:hypothetical protein